MTASSFFPPSLLPSLPLFLSTIALPPPSLPLPRSFLPLNSDLSLTPPYLALPTCVHLSGSRSGWFKHIEPHRTYTILTITELARCVGCLCTRSGWFKHIEPHRTYTNQFGVVQAQRTNTNHTITELARCVGCLCTRSGWFKHSEPHRTSRNSPAQR